MNIPTEAETKPEDLSVKQTIDMLNHLFSNVLSIKENVYAEEDGVIRIGNEFRLWKDSLGWHLSQNYDLALQGVGYIAGHPEDNPMRYFSRIIGRLSVKESLDKYYDWVLTSYCCMS